jgi:uncharacterized iron-regulated membrane protein
MFGQGNPLYGVTGKFGLIGLLVLFITGLLVQLNKPSIEVNALQAVEVILNAKPYKSSKMGGSLLLPTADGRVLALAPEAMKVVRPDGIEQLEAGTKAIVGMPAEDAAFWQSGQSKRNFLLAYTLQIAQGKEVVNPNDLDRWQRLHNNTGAWLMLLALMLLPYAMLQKPRISIWITILLYMALVAAYSFGVK